MGKGVDYVHDCEKYYLRVQVYDTFLSRYYAQIPKDAVEYACKVVAREVRKAIRLALREWDDRGHRRMEHRYRMQSRRYRILMTASAKRSCTCFPGNGEVIMILHRAAKSLNDVILAYVQDRKEKGGDYKRW